MSGEFPRDPLSHGASPPPTSRSTPEERRFASTGETEEPDGGDLETLVRILRSPSNFDPFRDEPALAVAMERACRLLGDASPRPTEASEAEALGAPVQLGPYRMVRRLGAGGMGTVYLAVHSLLDKKVAVKILSADRVETESLARFHREMKAVGRLDHPHIVRALDAGECDGVHFLAMEHVDGMDLAVLLKKLGRLPPPVACMLIVQAAQGLNAAHKNGIVHRDVKPSNLMLGRQEHGSPVVKVLDLGVASAAGTGVMETVTRAGQVFGTIDYMAPEQADGRTPDARADIWSLGATLYALLTGETIYAGRGASSVLRKLSLLANEPVPRLRPRYPEISDKLDAVVARMLAMDPSDRHASMAEVVEALQPHASGAELAPLLDDTIPAAAFPVASLADSAAKPAASQPIAAPAKRRRGGMVGGALIGLMIVGGIWLSLRTATGKVIVEIPDDLPAEWKRELSLRVTGDGVVEVANAANGWSIALKEGVYSVQLQGGHDRLQLQEDRVTVTRRHRTIVELKHLPAPEPSAVSEPPDSVVATSEAGQNPNRAAVQWVLSLGAGSQCYVKLPGRLVTLDAGDPLPDGNLRLHGFHIDWTLTDRPDAEFWLSLARELHGVDMHYLSVRCRTWSVAEVTSLAEVPGLKDITDFSMNGVQGDDEFLTALSRFSKLKTVSLVESGGVTARGLKALQLLPNLENVALLRAKLTANDLEALQLLPGLLYLDLGDMACTPEHLAALSNLNVEHLMLGRAGIDDAAAKKLPPLARLKTLNLLGNPLTDACVASLAELKSLEALNLSQTAVTAAGLATLQQSLPGCKIEIDP